MIIVQRLNVRSTRSVFLGHALPMFSATTVVRASVSAELCNASACAGVLTTWKKGILLRGGPRTRRFALYKAVMEVSLFVYMAPFIMTVCYWFLTTPRVSIWLRLTKCVMELPSVVFQFTWAAACVKYWHMLDEDGTFCLQISSIHV
jgi:hypothetical protein